MASSSSTSNQFRLPRPNTIQEVANLNPPSVETIEANVRRIIDHHDRLEARCDRGLQRLVTLSEKTTAAVGARTLSDRERMRSWHLLEKEVKRAKEQVATAHEENTVWMSCAKVYQKYMWEYFKSLDKAAVSVDDLELRWTQERRYLINLCRRHIPADAAERLDLTEVLQDEMEGGDEEGEDVSLGFLADMYTERVRELKREATELEQENMALKAQLILAGGEIATAVAKGGEPVRATHASEPATERGGAPGPSRVLHGGVPPNHYDAEAFTHVLGLYHQTRDFMNDLITSHTFDKSLKTNPKQWESVWVNFNKQFQALRLVAAQVPVSLTERVAELDLELGEPEYLRTGKTDPKWAPVQAMIDGEVSGKSKEELLEIVGECKAVYARTVKEYEAAYAR